VDVKVGYRLRLIDEPLPKDLALEITTSEGTVVESHSIKGKAGAGEWTWKAENPGWNTYSVRIVDPSSKSLKAAARFAANPRCVLGVSTKHCEEAPVKDRPGG
jgi:hypothetical protein